VNSPAIRRIGRAIPSSARRADSWTGALDEAGIDRAESYLTNAVKHFKFIERGKRRIQQRPTTGEVRHYRWWLDKELEFIDPHITVALGAVAVLALVGKALPISRNRGEAQFQGRRGFITVHPSSILRQPDAAQAQAYEAFVADLRQIRRLSRAP